MLDAVAILVLMAVFPPLKTGFHALFRHLMSGIQF